MSTYDYDLFTIGAGSGGVRASRLAAQFGARTAIAEEYRFGGTCVIRGCVPKKLFVYASRFAGHFADSGGFGWKNTPTQFDWPSLIRNKDREIERLSQIYVANLEKAGVEIYRSRAELVGPHEIKLHADDRVVTAKHILIATGGRPFVPPVPGAECVISSNDAFHLTALPNDITIVGGGYIAVEFAGIFNGLGVDTRLVYRGEQILRGFDDELRGHLSQAMRGRGITIETDRRITEIQRDGAGMIARFDNGEQQRASQIMYATGRRPNSDGLGLEAINIATNRNGAIMVDDAYRTNLAHIFAVGDVTDRVNLTPVAIREGAALATNLFGGGQVTVDYNNIPTAVFSQPELATVGLTEEQARAQADVRIYRSQFRPLPYTLAGRSEQMLIKLIVEQTSDKILGCHIIGPDAAEMIQLVAVAMNMGATKADFDGTMALHPSIAEELVTLA